MARSADQIKAGDPKRVLLVEDDPMVATSVEMLLRIDGHEVEICPNAEAALAAFQPARHDVVFSDLRLPGMDGLQLAEAIRGRAPKQPIILISGSPEVVEVSLQSSLVNVLLGKPFELRQLQEALIASLRPSEIGQPRTISV